MSGRERRSDPAVAAEAALSDDDWERIARAVATLLASDWREAEQDAEGES